MIATQYSMSALDQSRRFDYIRCRSVMPILAYVDTDMRDGRRGRQQTLDRLDINQLACQPMLFLTRS